MSATVEMIALEGLPEIAHGDDLAAHIADALDQQNLALRDGDVLTIAHKVVSKSEGRVRDLADITPGEEARKYGSDLSKDPRKVQAVLDESSRVLRAFKHAHATEGTMICEHRLGFISANAAVDESNTADEHQVILLPEDPDGSAQHLRAALEELFGVSIGIIVTDTFGRPWRLGQVNVAIGLAGVPATINEAGGVDARGRPLRVTEPAFADEVAAASGLVIGKAAQTPVVLFRGLRWPVVSDARAGDLLRAQSEDVFR
jgi:coenzyme F420-0:L-glutamate ligase/coenzyme F420-1:gamma-L-glutamate ligase